MATPSYVPVDVMRPKNVPRGPVTTSELRGYFQNGPLATFDLSSLHSGVYGRVRNIASRDPHSKALVKVIEKVSIDPEHELKDDSVGMLTSLPDVSIVGGEYNLGWRKEVFYIHGQERAARAYAERLFDINYDDINVLRVLNYHGPSDARFIGAALKIDLIEARDHALMLRDAGLVTAERNQATGGKKEAFKRVPVSELK